MTLQNRVTPTGEIVAVSARGTLMGNRGNLHGDGRVLLRTQASRMDWVTCRLDFKGRKRPIMAPGKYTELFFLDEATALAAGHRPCNECRPERLAAFKEAWAVGVEGQPGMRLLVTHLDTALHRDRFVSKGIQRRFEARLGDLPDGVMVQLPGEARTARLKWNGRLHRWTASGYVDPQPLNLDVAVTVLTPQCTVKTLAAGYLPAVHASAS